jgi:DNA polymerase IIIc chi subunit
MAKNENETKRNKFVRLAEARINKALDQLKLISNLSDRSTYEFTDDDVIKIFTCLEKELKTARSRFSSIEESTKFKL